ncbi:hypothetical protein [Alicyclobacillus sacchari]|uniref:hypothetical protein n=1 Tax=Alicyclobacillus sacchari TaxID=392010 RepID=UPI001FB92EAD|nr:hypothetical protein [Alicyclobacillus sacchari]
MVNGPYGFTLTDNTNPSDLSSRVKYYAGSDVYTLSGWYAQPNPYSNTYWYAPGQYVHLAPYAKPYVRIDSVQNGQSLVPGSTVTVTDTNNDPSDDSTGNPDKVPGSGTPSGLIAVWYFNNMGTYVNADVGHSNEQVATYGFTPWQDTYIPAIAPTRSFQITVPSGASGSGMLYLYYVDGIDRYYEASYAVKTAAPASPPSVTFTANPTSLPAGKGSVVTATGKNVPANDYIELKDVSGLDTIAGENTYSDGVYGETSLSQTVYSSTPETAKYQAVIINGNTGHVDATSGTVSVTWTSSGNTGGTNGNGGNGPTITLSASPTSLATGKYTGVTAIASGNTSGDFIEISDLSGAGTFDGSNTFEDGVVGETGLSGPAVSQTPQTVTYQASIINASTGQTVAMSNQVQVTWNSGSTGSGNPYSPVSITLSASPTSLQINQPSQLTATVNGNTTGDYIEFVDMGNGYTLQGANIYADHLIGESQSEVSAISTIAQTGSYTADVINASTGAIIAQSNEVLVTWTLPQETIYVSASPTQLNSGQSTTISYQASNLQPGDKVVLSGVGASPPFEEIDTASTGSFTDMRNPANGQSVAVTYSAEIVNAAGQVVAHSNSVGVTWKSTPPAITLTADRTSNQPGESDHITYSVTGTWAQGDYVVIQGTGGTDAWNVANDPNMYDVYTETENPASGQTVTVHYTGTVYDSSGDALSTSTLDVNWVNAWTGTITLTANPKYLPTGQSTTLTATTSEPIPSGWSLVIMDETTGQTVSTSGTSSETAQYTSFDAETDTFIAWLNDGYEQIGTESNSQTVVWTGLSLSANPTLLPSGQATTLTVSGQNVPSGDYLVIVNESTGQLIGSSLSTPYTVQVTESEPQTDNFVAYVSTNSGISGELMQSNTMSVDWYGVTLTATKNRLFVNNSTTLTATALNMPSGYVLEIEDLSTGGIIATGQPGQMVVSSVQTRNQPEMDQYEAEVVQPGNPTAPSINNNVGSIPFWTFTQMPGYIPLSAFNQTAIPSTNYARDIWFAVGGTNVPNGVGFFLGSFFLSSSQAVTFNINGTVDDYEQVYVDGHAILQAKFGGSGQEDKLVGSGIPESTSTTIQMSSGEHQVVIEGLNDNGFSGSFFNPAGVNLQVVSNGVDVLDTSDASQWMSTGYISQLPSGWFSGEVGTWSWEQTLLQESSAQPVYEQQTFTLTTPAANVSATSTPVSVTWYSYDLGLSATPTTLRAGQATTLTATSTTGGGPGDVIEIYDETTGKVVGTSTPNASSYSATWTESAPTTDTFIAWFVNPSGGHDQASNTVQVTWNQAKLTLSDAEVYHTPEWQQNLQNYNNYYTNVDPQPQLVRSESDFWAGEDLLFKVKPSITDIAQAYVYLPAISMNPMMPPGSPINWTSPPPIALTYNPSDGYLEGDIPTAWDEWLQYMQDGTYTVTFWVKSTDNQVATAQASFTIRDTWVSGNDPGTYFHEHQTW